jgi:transcriptional regulator with XRE-family HTH domain
MTPAQCRAARALLRWTQDDLAGVSGVSDDTVRGYETGQTQPRDASLSVMRDAFEAAGVGFIDEDSRRGPGLQGSHLASAAHCRIARGLLDWKQSNLTQTTQLSVPTIGKFEAEQVVPLRATLRKIRRAFEAAGVIFIEEFGEIVAVRLRKGLR